jgi:hypothetical protein
MARERGEEERVNPSSLDWRVHPFRERLPLGSGILVGIVALSLFAGVWGQTWFWSLFCFLVLFFSLESFYFPTRFILEEKKVTIIRRFSKSEKEWTVFKRCTVDRQGVTLSPFVKSSWLETYRAIQLRFSPENRESVLGFIRERLGNNVEWIQDRRSEQDRKGA